MKVRLSARTDVGRVRDHNEDSYGAGDEPDVERFGHLFVVCDGMGGHAAGEVASRMAVDIILSSYYGDDDEDRPLVLKRAFEQANAAIHDSGRGKMGTTGVAALLHHDALHIANVGDSRAYLIRDDLIQQISEDHSFVHDQVVAGLISAEEARISPVRNVITRALGHQPSVTVDLFRRPLQIGDSVLLSSDGMHSLVNDAEIAQVVADNAGEAAVEHLVEIANERGGNDNITVVLAQVEALDWDAALIEDATETPTEEHNSVAVSPEPGAGAQLGDRDILPAHRTTSHEAPVRAGHPVERRITLLGGLLATVMLTVLVFVILFGLSQPAEPAPTVVPPTVPIGTPRQ
jgi:protein phosphatase